MSYQPYPNRCRALRHMTRGHRLLRQTWRDGVGREVEVRVYPGVVSQGIEAEVRRIVGRECRHRGTR